MKSIHLLILLLFTSLFCGAQNCLSLDAASYKEISKKFQKAKTDSRRISLAENLVLGQCFSANQITGILDEFDDDFYKSEFLKTYSNTIVDFQNVQIVFNSFDKISNALNCYEVIRPKILAWLENAEEPVQLMSDEEFKDKFKIVKLEKYSSNKKKRISFFFKNASLTYAQVEKILSQFRYNSDKKWVLKLLYPNCAEKDEYYKFTTLFNYSSDRDEILSYINQP